MGVKFDKGVYLKVFSEKNGLENKQQVIEHGKKHQDFSVGISFSEFNKEYKGKGWIGRKIVALPRAAWSGVVKVTFHLAMALLVGSLSALGDDGQYFKVQLFCVIRDLEEASGWVATLIYDSYGQYLVQESLFHKSYYECSLIEESLSPQESSVTYSPAPTYSPKNDSYSPEKPDFKSYSPKKPDFKSFSPEKPDFKSYSPKKPDFKSFSPEKPEFKSFSPKKPFKSFVPEQKKEYVSIAVESALQQEYENIKNLSYSERKAPLVVFAEKCLNADSLEKAVQAIKDSNCETDKKEGFFVKVANAYLVRGEAKEALDVIGGIYSNSKLKEGFFTHVANHYLLNGDIEKSVDTIKKVYSDSKVKEAFFHKAAKAYLEKGDVDNAVSTIKSIYSDTKMKEDFLKEVADACVKNGDMKKGLDVISSVYSDSKAKEVYYVKAARAYLAKGDREEAADTIKKVYGDSDSKDQFLSEIAESYFLEGKFNKGLDVNRSIYHDTKSKEAYIIKIANAYLAKGDEENALDTIRSVYHDSDTKEAMFEQVAEKYFKNGKLEKALDTAKSIYHKTDVKVKLIHKIVNAYLAIGKIDKAFDALTSAWSDSQETKLLFVEIAQIYSARNEASELTECVAELVKIAFKLKLKGIRFQLMYYNVIGKNLRNDTFKTFIRNIAQEALQDKNLNDPTVFIKAVEAKSCEPNKVEAFLRFAKEYVPNDYLNSLATKKTDINPYEVFFAQLEIPSTSSKEDVKTSYKKLCRKYHPDKVTQNNGESIEDFVSRKRESEEKFKLVAQAYEALMNAPGLLV